MEILTIAGTRPEIIKLVPVVRALREIPGVSARFCHSGQHTELGRNLLAIAGITPDEDLSRPAAPDLGTLLGGLVSTIGAAIDRQKPDAVVVQGDTATTLAGALAAFHRHIPIAHVEAGLRSHDMTRPWPEEAYRRLITPLARWQFAPTPGARDALMREGIASEDISVVGNTAIDALRWASDLLDVDEELGDAAAPLIAQAQGRRLVLATVHRRELDADGMQAIAKGLRALADSEDILLIVPLHPRPESEALRGWLSDTPDIALVEPLDYFSFVRLMRAARLLITDSGGIQEEATALGRPALVLREVTERGEAVAVGAARLIGHDPESLVTAARWALARPMPEPSDAFGDGQAAMRIARTMTDDLSR